MRGLLALLRKELLYHRLYPWSLVSMAVSPFLIVSPYIFAARIYPSAELHESVAVGLLLWYWLSTFFWSVGFAVRDEIAEGLLESLLVTPTPLWQLLVAKALDNLLVNLYMTAAVLALLRLLAGVALPVLSPGFPAVMLAAALAFAGLATVYAGLVLTFKQASEVGSLTQDAMGILSGMTEPTAVLPGWIRWVSGALPLTYAIRGGRTALTGVFPAADLAVLTAFGLLLLAGGMALFSRAVHRLRVEGGADEY